MSRSWGRKTYQQHDMVTFFLSCAVCFLWLSPVMVGVGEARTIDEVVGEIQRTYEGVKDIKASFVQEVILKAMKRSDREEGVVYFKNPQKMLWEYQKPKIKKMIVNPQKAWIYIPDDRVAYVQDADYLFKSKLIVRFISGMGQLKEDFSIEFSSKNRNITSGDLELLLTPKEGEIGVNQLSATFHRDSYLLIACQFIDAYGNRTQIQFRNIKINNQLSDQLFVFKPPKNVEVLQMP